MTARFRGGPWSRACTGPLLALLGGLAVAIAIAPFSFWPLAPVGCGLLAISLEGAELRGRLLRGWCFGLGQFGVGLFFTLEFSGIGFVLLVVVEALFPAVAAMARGRSAQALSLGAALAVAEWLRAQLPFGGLPPGGLPLAAIGSPFEALARVGGPLLVTLVVATSGAALAAVGSRLASHRGAVAPSVVLAVALLVTALAAVAPEGGADRHLLHVAAVQGGGPRGLHQEDAFGATAFERSYDESVGLHGPFGLVLWPEDTVPLPHAPPASTILGKALSALAHSLRSPLLVGVTEPVGTTRFLNEQVAFSASGRTFGTIEKVHAVPFGEYVPLRSLLRHLVSLAAVPRDAIVGRDNGVLQLPGDRVGLLISYETFFPERGREEVRAGAQALLVPTNTASYASGQEPAQELAATRLEAIATGRYALQAATTGYSALVSPSGSVLQSTELDEATTLTATLPLRGGFTLYDRFGELPSLVVCAAVVVFGLWRKREDDEAVRELPPRRRE